MSFPVTGRSEPREAPAEHDQLTFWPEQLPGGTLAIAARCGFCGWETLLEGGHDAADLARLDRMHRGTEPGA